MALEKEHCEACRADAPQVTEQEQLELLAELPDWQVVECDGVKQLQRMFTFKDFQDALNFTNQVGELAEIANHHPTITLTWGKVTVAWWTHKIRGLHRNDFILAARTEHLPVIVSE